MMQRITVFLLAVSLFIPLNSFAQDVSRFSGTWKMDPSQSESAHQDVPIGPVTLVIKQTPTEISVETRRNDSKKTGPTSEMLTFKLDGSEYTATGMNATPVKTKTHWDGEKLVLESERNVNNSTITVTDVHSLNATRNEMTVERRLIVQHGYQGEGAKNTGMGKDVFLRVKTPPR